MKSYSIDKYIFFFYFFIFIIEAIYIVILKKAVIFYDISLLGSKNFLLL